MLTGYQALWQRRTSNKSRKTGTILCPANQQDRTHNWTTTRSFQLLTYKSFQFKYIEPRLASGFRFVLTNIIRVVNWGRCGPAKVQVHGLWPAARPLVCRPARGQILDNIASQITRQPQPPIHTHIHTLDSVRTTVSALFLCSFEYWKS